MTREPTTEITIGKKTFDVPTRVVNRANTNMKSFVLCSLCRDVACLTTDSSKPSYCSQCAKKKHLISKYQSGSEPMGEPERKKILMSKTTRSGPFFKIHQ